MTKGKIRGFTVCSNSYHELCSILSQCKSKVSNFFSGEKEQMLAFFHDLWLSFPVLNSQIQTVEKRFKLFCTKWMCLNSKAVLLTLKRLLNLKYDSSLVSSLIGILISAWNGFLLRMINLMTYLISNRFLHKSFSSMQSSPDMHWNEEGCLDLKLVV